MAHALTPEYIFYDDPLHYFNVMLDDISNAQQQIYLQTYRFNNDSIGIKFRDAITRAAGRGVEVKLLLDSWGTSLPANFFSGLNALGGEVRYFKKIRLFWDFFTKNHRRNHRKLLIIDSHISYIGSANITDYSLNWRESMLRIKSDLAIPLKKIFLQDFRLYNKYVFEQISQVRKITHGGIQIIRDVPSLTKQRIRKSFVSLIRSASKEVIIETPYFLPGFVLRKTMMDAAKSGISLKVLIPMNSDVGLIDILRNRYLGILHRAGVGIYYYLPHNLHSKLLQVDNEIFAIGSPNFDYRSFRYQHEIVIIGQDESVIAQLNRHFSETLLYSELFDYEKWLQRPWLQKLFEKLLLPFRHLM
ncbi:MAG: phosphatidylserine/phosphatidylglycerophosphate/cardiolipin synthase family protein [Bacteroidales bacterium]|nr:phosphatidylserine/phosphatidylglycerophosphate/cardiolipin synthase family protein [Bacteroidales bacterium]